MLDALIAAYNLPFVELELLETALTHRSFVHEKWALELQSNERLEFLGDSVLNFAVAHFLFQTYPDKSEGQLTTLRAALIRAPMLAHWARNMHLGAYLRLGKGEEQSGGRERENLLADAFEAVIAAIFVVGGMPAADRFLARFVPAEAQRIVDAGMMLDNKSQLQERMQGERSRTPRYRTIQTNGPEHNRRFTVEVVVDGVRWGVGEGPSLQQAAQQAAHMALRKLDAGEEPGAPDPKPSTQHGPDALDGGADAAPEAQLLHALDSFLDTPAEDK